MNKLIAAFTATLGIMAGLTSLSATAAGAITYGAWYFQSDKASMIGFDIQRQCTYSRTRWQAGYGSLQNEYYTIYVVNRSCPSVAQAGLPK